MATVNNAPLFSGKPQRGNATFTSSYTANTKSDGTGTIGTDILLAFTADATYGSYVSAIRLSPWATSAGTATTATVFRIFISSQTSGATTNANTWLIVEVAAASQTADSSSAATFFLEIPINRALKAGDSILITAHAAPATNTGWTAVVFAGDFINVP